MTLHDGDLQTRLRLERPVTTPDAWGQPDITQWQTVTHLWAKRSNMINATTEAIVSGAEVYRESVRFDLRPREIKPEWRIVDVRSGQIFNIQSIALSNDRSELAVLAVA